MHFLAAYRSVHSEMNIYRAVMMPMQSPIAAMSAKYCRVYVHRILPKQLKGYRFQSKTCTF